MSPMTSGRVAAGALAVLAAALLAGCGSSATPSGGTAASTPAATSPATTSGGATPDATPSVVVTFTKGVPSGVSPTHDVGEAFVVWGAPGYLDVVTYGSSTCPVLPETVTYSSGDGLVVTMAKPDSTRPCTMDLVPTTSTVKAPEGLADGASAKATIEGKSTTLPAR